MENINLAAVLAAIHKVQEKILWKPGKASIHLAKRIRLGHLPENSSLEDYETIINLVVHYVNVQVYLYVYETISYPTLVAPIKEQSWLVMFSLNGVLETAFPPEDPEKYLSNSSFIHLGLLKDLEV